MQNQILEIEDVVFDEKSKTVTVTAIVDDVIQTQSSTWFDPPEYGPARCETSFEVEEDDVIDYNDHQQLEDYLKTSEWNIIRDTYDEYYD